MNIRIVLVQTWHPGNIGAAARAMKNMGLHQMTLVNPVDFPSVEAYNRAGKAVDVLDNARIVSSLAEAISDCQWVVATSARDRSIRLPAFSAEECGKTAVAEQHSGPVAIVFGRERMGLHNDDIQQCHAQVNIDSSPEYPVLNLSQAVQLISYEIFKAYRSGQTGTEVSEAYPLHQELQHFYHHLDETLHSIGFLKPSHSGQTLDHLRALFRRARPTSKELKLLRGVLSAAEASATAPGRQTES